MGISGWDMENLSATEENARTEMKQAGSLSASGPHVTAYQISV
jgi:hypothetical protein